MIQFAARSILALTVGIALGRPRLFSLDVGHVAAAVLGALLCVAFGIVTVPAVGEYLLFFAAPVVTIVSLMTGTVVVSYWPYIRIGIPVTLSAILLALLTLHREMMLFDAGLV